MSVQDEESPVVPQLGFAHRPRMARTSSLGALRALSSAQDTPGSLTYNLDTQSNDPMRISEHAPAQVGLGVSELQPEQQGMSEYLKSDLLAESLSDELSPSFSSSSTLQTPFYTPMPPVSYRFPASGHVKSASAIDSPTSPAQFASYARSTSPSSSQESLLITPSSFPLPPTLMPSITQHGAEDPARQGSPKLEQEVSTIESDEDDLDYVAPKIRTSRKAQAILGLGAEAMEQVEREGNGLRQLEDGRKKSIGKTSLVVGEAEHESLHPISSSRLAPNQHQLLPSAEHPLLGSSPSHPLPAPGDRFGRRSSASPSTGFASSPSPLASSSASRLSHSASLPSLSSHLNTSPKSEKRSSFPGLVGLGRKKSSASTSGGMSPPLASPPPMHRSTSSPYQTEVTRPALLEVNEEEEDEDEDEEDDLLEGSPTRNEVRISSKAAALLGLDPTGAPVAPSPPRSAPMTPAGSKDSVRNTAKLQRGASQRTSFEGRRDSASEQTVHTYEHEPLPPFGSTTMEALLENEIASGPVFRYSARHHIIRSNRSEWRHHHLLLSSFDSPLTDPPTKVISLHYFAKTPAARDDAEVGRLELIQASEVFVPEDDLGVSGNSKVAAALKVTGLAPRETDERGRPLDVERKEESWIVGTGKVEEMAKWLKTLKGAVRELQEQRIGTRSASASPEREKRQRQASVRSTGSGRSSIASSIFESAPRMDRRPSQTSSTPYSLSPQSRRKSIPNDPPESEQARPRVLAEEMEPLADLHIRASPVGSLVEQEEGEAEEEEPATAHPYRMALAPPTKSPTKRISPPSSATLPSVPFTKRDSVSSAGSRRSSSSSQKHPSRPPPPASALPPLPAGPARTFSDPTALQSRRLSVMTTSTTGSSNSSGSLRSRLSGAPLPPQAPPPTSALPPPPQGQTPFRLTVPAGLSRSVSEPKEVHAAGGSEAKVEGRGYRPPPAFTSTPLPPPPPIRPAGTLPTKAEGSVKAKAAMWESR